MNKRGVELSMNVIIIAAIALIVLVVLILLVTGAFGNVRDQVSCSGKGGTCMSPQQCSQTDGVVTEAECPSNQNVVCCLPAPGGPQQ